MSRTTLCALTAAGLVTLSLLLMAGRYHVLGAEMPDAAGAADLESHDEGDRRPAPRPPPN